MARFHYRNRISATSSNPEIRQLQQQLQELVSMLNLQLNDIDAENIAPEFLTAIKNEPKEPVRDVKNRTANAYIDGSGEIFRIIGSTSEPQK